ncbi:hypothetical protein TSUD_84120 [Trifolium subterraneum]|uniref:Retrotransposon gag domain-containing protein n=1 Tax=Trifolium subterraneum TaxID=3900 RepID=A0A2Z6N4T5_TRISU|nr:hypothetical protein TSUD_84120 [Trifolium subterraneum]
MEDHHQPPQPPRRTMGDYYRRIDIYQISLGYKPANPVNFDIKSNIIASLRENLFDGHANKDPWDHLTANSQRLVRYRRLRIDYNVCQAKPSERGKELEDKFLERFFTHKQFQKRRLEILNFQRREAESLCEAYERFKLLKRKCPNHIIDVMEHMQIFTGCMKIQHMMHLDASAGGSIKMKTEEEARQLIEQMCQNEYNMNNERYTKTVGKLDLDKETGDEVENELLKRKLYEKASLEVSASKVQEVCDFCQEDHLNRHRTPKGNAKEGAKYMGNQRQNPYSNTYNPSWKNHPNFDWSHNSNQNQGATQNQQNPPPRKPSPLEEMLNQFMNMGQTNFESTQGDDHS